jgi:hypothetical protein
MHLPGAFFCHGLFQGIAVPMARGLNRPLRKSFQASFGKVAAKRHNLAQVGRHWDYGAEIAVTMISGPRR